MTSLFRHIEAMTLEESQARIAELEKQKRDIDREKRMLGDHILDLQTPAAVAWLARQSAAASEAKEAKR